jgi:hypothetical protein
MRVLEVEWSRALNLVCEVTLRHKISLWNFKKFLRAATGTVLMRIFLFFIKVITFIKSITLFYGIDNIMWNIPHIQTDRSKCGAPLDCTPLRFGSYQVP